MPAEYQSNAMTEIALALAMAFFSIMVLAMVSMGSAMQSESANELSLAEGIALSLPASSVNSAAPARAVAAEDMIIHWQGRFYDGALHVVDPAVLSASRRLVLAIGPDLSITEAMAVREKITAVNLEVTTLDARWLHILEERDL